MARLDKLTLIAFMHRCKEKLERKADSWVVVALWLTLWIAVRSAPVRNVVKRAYFRSAETADSFARRTIARLGFPTAAYLFSCCVSVLSGAAAIRSRTILAARSSRAPLASVHASSGGRPLRKRALRIAEAALWIVAATTLGYCSFAYASAALHQVRQKAAFKALESQADPMLISAHQVATRTPGPPVRGEALGILDIPRIGLSSIVEQGVDSSILRDSVGHIPGTALPGQKGNVALAAHRDTYFRHLSELRPGDEISFHSVSATYTYTVRSTGIVQPTDTSALAETKNSTLTLVTCFPFYYVGSAPKRYVLVATQDHAAVISASSR